MFTFFTFFDLIALLSGEWNKGKMTVEKSLNQDLQCPKVGEGAKLNFSTAFQCLYSSNPVF